MLVDLQRAIKVGAVLDWAVTVIFNHAAPENCLAFVVGGFQFEPSVVCIHSAAGEKVADCLGANDDIYANRIATAQRRHGRGLAARLPEQPLACGRGS